MILRKRYVEKDDVKLTEVLIAYRIYETEGEKSDEMGQFTGWSMKYDEWLNIMSVRLAQHGTKTRRDNYYMMESRDDTYHVDDIDDSIYNNNQYNIMVFRKNLDCRSNSLKLIVQEFANLNISNILQDGYESILRILTTDVYLTVDELLSITHCVSNLTP